MISVSTCPVWLRGVQLVGFTSESSDVGKDFLYDSYSYNSLIDLGFTEPSQDEIDYFESDRDVEMFTSKSFQDNMKEEIKKSTWDLGLPMSYMNSLKQLVYHYKDGTIKIIKNLSKLTFKYHKLKQIKDL